MIKENQLIKQKLIYNYIEKFKSSIKNNYCLFCRNRIKENHICEFLSNIENILLEQYFQLDEEFKKNIIEELSDLSIKNEEFIQNIRNKILAYSL